MVRDDAPDSVTVSFAQAGYTVSEGSTTTVTVMLSEHPDSTVTIPMTKTNLGGATRTDYSGVPDSLTFNSGDDADELRVQLRTRTTTTTTVSL